MNSSCFLWEFDKTWEELPLAGLVTVLHGDSTSEFFANKIIKKKESWVTVLGKEVTKEWLNKELFELDLFGNNNPVFIMEAQHLSGDVIDLLLENQDFEKRCVLSFTAKSQQLRKLKKQKVFVELKELKSWKKIEAIRYFESFYKVNLDQGTRQLISDLCDSSYYELSQKVYWLSILNSEEKNEHEFDSQLRLSSFVDIFAYADLINQKKKREFWRRVLNLSKKERESSLGFFVSHTLKMTTLEEIREKSRPTMYDKKILQASNLWSKAELSNFLKQLVLIQKKSRLNAADLELNLQKLSLQ